jgi:hypothetical protein
VLGHGGGPLVFRAGPRRCATTRSRGYDDLVTALRRRAARPLLMLATAVAVVAAAGCATGPGRSTPAGPAGSGPTAVPGGRASQAASVRPPSTTETEFGTIYDSLPSTFPKLVGQEPAPTGAGPTSGSFVANMSVTDARKIIEVGLIAQGWRVAVGSPLEDGSVVLEATAAGGCKTEVRFVPLSGTVIMSVLYGASCPFS